jgi:excinuclease ABC subunit C
MDEAGVHDIALVGIAKRLEELWLPDDDFPVIMPRNSEALFLIQRIRDEAHRFAITHQRTRRKRDVRSQLSEIPGLGPTRVNALLKHFGSVARLREATAEQIAEVNGVGPATAAAVVTKLAQTPRSAPEASAPGASAPQGSPTDPGLPGASAPEPTTATAPDALEATGAGEPSRASRPVGPVRVPTVSDDGPSRPG